MATWSKLFSFFTWKNRPDTSTPLGQTLLNRLNTALNGIDDRVVTLNAEKVSVDEMQAFFTDVRLIKNTGQFVFTLYDGTEKIIDTALEKISINVSFDQDSQMLVLEKEDGSKEYVDLSAFTTQYEFASSPTIQQTVTDGKVTANIKPNSITDQMLQTNYLADITTQANTALSASQSALESQSLAEQSAEEAKEQADRAKAEADRAESVSAVDIATTEKAGIVKPDGTTITVDSDGTIHGNASVTVDTELSTESTNPIANKAVAEALENVDAKTLDGYNASYFAEKTEVSGLEEGLIVERERINNLVANTGEQTEGNSELIDIRVGANGTTYATAGEAVREQIGDLKSDLYSDVLSVIDENTPNEVMNGKIIGLNGNLEDLATWKTMCFVASEDFEMYVTNTFKPNYFRIAIYDGEITSANMLGLYQKNIDSSSNTLPTVDNKASVKTGNIVAFSTTAGTASYEIQKKTTKIMFEIKKMFYTKTEDAFDIYIPSKTSDNYIHYVYKHDVDSSTNLDTWRFYTYEITDTKFNRLYGCSEIAPSIEMDSVVKETNQVDFMGGYHGDENMTAFSAMVDGKGIDTSSEIPLTEFYKEIRFCGTSTMDRCNTPGDAMFTRYKTNVFCKDGYYSKQRWVALQECNLHLAYMGMMSLPVVDNGVTMVDTARMDNNYLEQKFHDTVVVDGAKYPSKDVREVEIYGSKLYGKARFFADAYDSTYRAFCDDSQNNNFKAYFRVGVGVSTLAAGSELRGEMHVEFMY